MIQQALTDLLERRSLPRTQAREVMEQCQDRLAEKERLVGRFYQRRKQWLAAFDRYEAITRNYPRYSRMSDVLLDLGRCLLAMNRGEEARDVFARLAQRDDAGKRAQMAERAMRDYERRREKEGEKLFGGLSEKDKPGSATP